MLTFLNRCVGDRNSWNRTVRFDVKFDVIEDRQGVYSLAQDLDNDLGM